MQQRLVGQDRRQLPGRADGNQCRLSLEQALHDGRVGRRERIGAVFVGHQSLEGNGQDVVAAGRRAPIHLDDFRANRGDCLAEAAHPDVGHLRTSPEQVS